MKSLASSTSSGWVICPPAGTTPRAYSLAARDAAATTRRARARESGACPASGCARQAVINRRVFGNRTPNTRVTLSEFQSVDRTAIATAASCVWERDSSTRFTRNSACRVTPLQRLVDRLLGGQPDRDVLGGVGPGATVLGLGRGEEAIEHMRPFVREHGPRARDLDQIDSDADCAHGAGRATNRRRR